VNVDDNCVLLLTVSTQGYFLDFWRAFCDEEGFIYQKSEKDLK